MTSLLRSPCTTDFSIPIEPHSRAATPGELAFSKDYTEEWNHIIECVLTIRGFKDDWDGEGSEAPRVELVDYAISLAQDFRRERVPAPDRVVASVNATVSFEWYDGSQFKQLEVVSPHRAELQTIRECDGYVTFCHISR